jgi:hypothetical protein
MSSDFKVIEKPVRGNIIITMDTQINDLDALDVTVAENTQARLYGKIRRSLTIKKGASVILHGSLDGAVKNEGGEFRLF